MANTQNFNITLLDAAQAQKEVTLNEALSRIDAFAGGVVEDKDLVIPPAAPTVGRVYIVGENPTGVWVGKAKQLAYYDAGWCFVVPQEGTRVWVKDEGLYYHYSGANWKIVLDSYRRGSAIPFSPRSASSGTLRAWYDFGDFRSLTFTSNLVSAVSDKSGNGYTANQPTAGNRAAYGATVLNNNASGMDFYPTTNGADLIVTDAANIQNIFAGGGAIFCSFNINPIDNQNSVIVRKSTDVVVTSGYQLGVFRTASDTVTLRFIVGASPTAGQWDVTGLRALTTYVVEVYYNSNTPTTAPVIIINGVRRTVTVAVALSGTPATDAGANLILANGASGTAANAFKGIIGGIALFRGSNTTDFYTRLRAYFAARAGIPIAPVFLQIGQSNSVGEAPVSEVSYDTFPDLSADRMPMIWDGNAFVPLTIGTNIASSSARFGPEISGMAQLAGLLGTAPYLVKYVLGATSLAVNWAATAGAQWIAMRAAIDAALPAFASAGMVPIVAGVHWQHGETDASSLAQSAAYEANLRQFILDVKNIALANYSLSPDFRFVIGGLGGFYDSATIPYVAAVTAAQQVVGAETGNVYFSTNDLTDIGDQAHFNAPGQIAIGQRAASSMVVGFFRSQKRTGRMAAPIAANPSRLVSAGTATPAIALGTGAGTSPTSKFISGNDSAGVISFTSGTAPATTATIATVTFGQRFANGSVVVLTPLNAATQALTGATAVRAVGSRSNFIITSGTTALAASTAYSWGYVVVGY